MWPRNSYLWIFVDGIAGGTDVYFERTFDEDADEGDEWFRLDDIRSAPRYRNDYHQILESTQKLDYFWCFRRSAGQPPIINLAYGVIAATLAEITEGLITSSDGAWDYSALPATGPEFLDVFFVPGRAEDDEFNQWAATNIQSLKRGLSW